MKYYFCKQYVMVIAALSLCVDGMSATMPDSLPAAQVVERVIATMTIIN